MTFDSAAWAIDGPTLSASLARRAAFANAKQSGVVDKGDLKVTQLDTPGVGVKITAGVGLILNEYQTTPNETYVTNNPGTHTIPSGSMPASNPSAKSYIVAVVIGDPDFSQVGHPWMDPSDPPLGEENTFQYVRPTVIEVSAGETDVPGAFPALPLARLDIPANTTTITDAMITDLRVLANPRSKMEQAIVQAPAVRDNLTAQYPTYERWPDAPILTVKIPAWATKAKVIGSIAGIGFDGGAVEEFQVYIEGHSGTHYGFNSYMDYRDTGVYTDQASCPFGGTIDVSSLAGLTKTFSIRARLGGVLQTVVNPAWVDKVYADGRTIVMMSVFFEESIV